MAATTNELKINLVEKLVQEKAITFKEALLLLETEKEYVYQPPLIGEPWFPQPPIITYTTSNLVISN